MADRLVIYMVLHQPRRLRLPAQELPRGAAARELEELLFDDAMDRRYFTQVEDACYRPAVALFRRLAREEGLALTLGMSRSFLAQADAWSPELVEALAALVREPRVEVAAVEPLHSFLFYVDIRAFVREMRAYSRELAERFGLDRPPVVADTTEMFMSNDIFYALKRAGFKGVLMDGRGWLLGWRQPSHVYCYDGLPLILTRHHQLSDDVGYRFSQRSWSGWPLHATEFAKWLAAAQGDVVTLGWDFETFGEHHGPETGIFDFIEHLAAALRRQGVDSLTASEALDALAAEAHHLPLPGYATTWAGTGDVSFFLGNAPQQTVFQLMHHAYNKAVLTGEAELIRLAHWLLQSDNLHLIQWYGRSDDEAQVSSYFTPGEWFALGADRLLHEQQQVYQQFIRALDGRVTAG